MDNNMFEKEQASPPSYNYEPEEQTEQEVSPVLYKQRLKRSYGSASMLMVIHLVVLLIVTFIGTTAASAKLTAQIMAENSNIDPNTLREQVQSRASELDLSMVVYIGGTVAGIAALIFAYLSLRTFKITDSLKKWRKVEMLPLGIISIVGIQGVSIFVITLMTMITGKTGMPESAQNTLSFSNDIFRDAMMLLYVVILGPVLEELMFRGFILNALSPVDKKFAVIVSAALFSLMHGNFAQFFNTFFVGLLLGYIAVKAGSIIPTIIAHFFLNLNAMASELIFKESPAVMIYFGVCALVGIPLLIIFLRKNGRITDEDRCIEGYDAPVPKTSEYTAKILFSRPSFWVVALYYLGNAVYMMAIS